jgi:hypothetical protein
MTRRVGLSLISRSSWWARIRPWIGPVMVGASAWCAIGHVAPVSPDAASARLAAPASWAWLVLFIAMAALVPAWRRRPSCAAPALLATVPWWPVPLPSIALIWTGPLAWLPILLAVVAAWPLASERRGISADEDASTTPPARRQTLAAGALTLVALVVVVWTLASRLPGGDEPHYLVITESLLRDGDLRIENNHANRDYAAFFDGTLAPDYLARGKNGAIYSVHAPGTSVLVLPAYWLFGYRGAQAMIVLISAIAGALVWSIGWLATGDARAAWIAWAAIVLSPTFLIQGVTIFPDGPAACIVCAAVVLLLRLRSAGTTGLVVTSALLAALPWLHTRFAVLAAGFGLVTLWAVWRDETRSPAVRWRRAAAFLAIPVVSAIGWFAFFQIIYGTPNPAAPYGPNPEARLAYVPGGLLALLFDEQFGLLVYTPVLGAAVVALAARRRDGTEPARAAVAIALVYLAVVATYWMWWAGVPATPARFAAVVLPVLAAPLAASWRRMGAWGHALVRSLLAVSLAITVIVFAVDRGALAWNVRGVVAAWLDWLGPAVDLSRGWPSFFWRLTPGDVTTEWPFALHVLVWVIVGAIVIAIAARFARRRPPASAVTIAAWCMAALVAGLVQTGWWLTSTNGLGPVAAGVQVLHAAAAGRTLARIEPLRVTRPRNLSGSLRLPLSRTDDQGTPAWSPIEGLPAGRYEVTIAGRNMPGGTLAATIGRSRAPLRRMTLRGASEQIATLDLPAGAATLTLALDPASARATRTIDIAPLTIDRSSQPPAMASLSSGSADVFFYDQQVFVEDDGFWVRGGQATDIAVAIAGAAEARVVLTMANGAAENDVTVNDETLHLAPGEAHDVVLTIPASGALPVHIRSAAGFRPSDVSSSQDRRYLGVRVRAKAKMQS